MVDLVLIALIIMFALNGYRQGFLVGALSFVGFFGGALVGLQLAPLVVERMASPFARVLVRWRAVFGLALLGQTVAAWAGDATAPRHPQRAGGRRADDVGGIFVSVHRAAARGLDGRRAARVLVDAVSCPDRCATAPSCGAVDAVMPDQARVLYDGLRDTIAERRLPERVRRPDPDPRPVRCRPPIRPRRLAGGPARPRRPW